MKLIHAADLHLDSPLKGLSRYEGAPVERIRGATRRAFVKLVDACLDSQAAMLLLAGDLFDGDWRDYSTGLFFCSQLSRLREGGVQVVIVRGNHDAHGRMTRQLPLPDNAHVLSERAPETLRFDALGVAVHGQSFDRRDVDEDLAARYPDAAPGYFNVGLLHTALEGRPGHAGYAPTTLQVLRSKGYDYWALGHVHAREVIAEDPYVVFPGNLQARHVNEGGPKGATLIEVEDGRVRELRALILDDVRFGRLAVDLTGCASADVALERVRAALETAVAEADGRLCALRLELGGVTAAHAALAADSERWLHEVRVAANDIGRERVWLEQVRLLTRDELDLDGLRARDDALGQLCRAIEALRGGGPELSALMEEFADLRSKLPPVLRDGDDALRLDDPAYFVAALDDVEQILLHALLAQPGPEPSP